MKFRLAKTERICEKRTRKIKSRRFIRQVAPLETIGISFLFCFQQYSLRNIFGIWQLTPTARKKKRCYKSRQITTDLVRILWLWFCDSTLTYLSEMSSPLNIARIAVIIILFFVMEPPNSIAAILPGPVHRQIQVPRILFTVLKLVVFCKIRCPVLRLFLEAHRPRDIRNLKNK